MYLIIIYIFSLLTQSYTLVTISGHIVQSYGHVGFFIPAPCSIQLKEGWNFISLCAYKNNQSFENVLGSHINNTRYILEWDKTNQNFKVWSPRSNNNPITRFNTNLSYFLYYVNNSTLSVSGTLYDDLNVSLNEGWNTPIYPYASSTNITKLISSINDSFRYLMKWNHSNQQFLIYSSRSTNNPFEKIGKGEGQFIYVYSDDILEQNKS